MGSGVGSTDHLHHRKKKAGKFGRIFGTFGNNPYLCAIKTLSNLKNNGMNNIESSKGEIVMYQPDETIRLEVRMDEETVWLSANQMAALFDRDEKTIRKHINNVFSENEVPKDINTHFLRVDGVKRAQK